MEDYILVRLNVFTRTDAEITKKTIRIYREELASEKRYLVIAGILLPIYFFFYNVLFPLQISFFTQALIVNSQNTRTPLLLLGGMAITAILTIITGRVGFLTLFRHQERMTTRLTERALKGLFAHSY